MRSKLILLVALGCLLTWLPSVAFATITVPTSISDFTIFGKTSVNVDTNNTVVTGRVGSNGAVAITLASNTTVEGDLWALGNVTLQDNGGRTVVGNIVSNNGLVSIATYGLVTGDVYGASVTLADGGAKTPRSMAVSIISTPSLTTA